MKETATMIILGAMWVLFKKITLSMLDKMITLAEQSTQEVMKGTGSTEHEFSKHIAVLIHLKGYILEADFEHYKVSKRIVKKGVTMCSKDEFGAEYKNQIKELTQEVNSIEQAARSSNPHR